MPSEVAVTLTAGALSGIVADVATHPICTVKARLMTQGVQAEGGVVYKGLADGFAVILRTEGVGALYSGIGAVVAGAAPAQALFFSGFEGCRSVMGDNPTGNFYAGLCAQLTGSAAWVPMEVIKEKLMIEGQLQTKEKYGSSLQLLRKVIATEGIAGVRRQTRTARAHRVIAVPPPALLRCRLLFFFRLLFLFRGKISTFSASA
jgi:hypothetical protein